MGKQTAKGTALDPAVATNIRKYRFQGGTSISSKLTEVTQNIGDGAPYGGSASHQITAIDVAGGPVLQATVGDLAKLLWHMWGTEAISTVTVNTVTMNQHVLTPPVSGSGHYLTSFRTLGEPGGSGLPNPLYEVAQDCKITDLKIDSNNADPHVMLTTSLMGLDIATFATLPTADFSTESTLMHFALNGSVVIDGVSYQLGQLSLDISRPHSVYRAETRTGVELVPQRGEIMVAFSVLLDADGLAMYNKSVYSSATPSAGTRPRKTVFTAPMSFSYTAEDGSGESIAFDIPKMTITPNNAPEGQVDGSIVEIGFASTLLPLTGTTPLITATAVTVEPSFT
jgi:hypothetical protein